MNKTELIGTTMLNFIKGYLLDNFDLTDVNCELRVDRVALEAYITFVPLFDISSYGQEFTAETFDDWLIDHLNEVKEHLHYNKYVSSVTLEEFITFNGAKDKRIKVTLAWQHPGDKTGKISARSDDTWGYDIDKIDDHWNVDSKKIKIEDMETNKYTSPDDKLLHAVAINSDNLVSEALKLGANPNQRYTGGYMSKGVNVDGMNLMDVAGTVNMNYNIVGLLSNYGGSFDL